MKWKVWEHHNLPYMFFLHLLVCAIVTHPTDHRSDQQLRIEVGTVKTGSGNAKNTHIYTHLELESLKLPLPTAAELSSRLTVNDAASPPPFFSSSSSALCRDVRSDEIGIQAVPLPGCSDVACVAGSEVSSLRKCILYTFPNQHQHQYRKYHTGCRRELWRATRLRFNASFFSGFILRPKFPPRRARSFEFYYWTMISQEIYALFSTVVQGWEGGYSIAASFICPLVHSSPLKIKTFQP